MAQQALLAALDQAGLTGAATVGSAGLAVDEAGAPADPRARAVLRARGYGTEHQARQLDAGILLASDLVVALTAEHERLLIFLASEQRATATIRLLRSFDPAAAGLTRAELTARGLADVADPFSGTPQDYERVLNQIEAAMPGILTEVRAMRPGPAS